MYRASGPIGGASELTELIKDLQPLYKASARGFAMWDEVEECHLQPLYKASAPILELNSQVVLLFQAADCYNGNGKAAGRHREPAFGCSIIILV